MAKKKQASVTAFEKLGVFYLGRVHDLEAGATTPNLLLYDAKDLTTHAVCVGMTGSGKTGLCVSLLEEAAMDGIPAIAIDPKGDLANMLLSFPNLRPADFRPWIDAAEATRKGSTPDEYASQVAEKWKAGLAEWGQDGTRIQQFRDATDIAVYTPGSSAGLQLTILKSFAAPPQALRDDADAFRERVAASVSGLLALVGIDADPIQSREHILLSNLFQREWQEGNDLDVATLIGQVQSPPFDKIGVMDIESFFPSKERFALSMSLNSLLASPGFAAWMEGEPLDVHGLLWTPEGQPRISILSIAHLSEAERMFFVTIVLNEVIAWMRTQSGTASLRALLYMDEVFGYFPPTRNPPSKTPMLTLLKQARAYGLGVVLATQNPVDLDYKGLSNAGTWFLGRLQTERDKMRVLEGLEGASAAAGASFDRQRMEQTLAGLKSRVFLMNNVHEDEPVLFQTRWAMSYLRGPLTRQQIQTLMEPRKETVPAEQPAPASPRARSAPKEKRSAVEASTSKPVIPEEIPQGFLATTSAGAPDARLVYRPALLGRADLHFADARKGIDQWETVAYLSAITGKASGDVWKDATLLTDGAPEVSGNPETNAEFGSLPSLAAKPKSYTSWKNAFKAHVYRNRTITLRQCKALKLTSTPAESESEFTVRVRLAAHERRDEAVEKLRKRYAPKLARVQTQIQTAERRVGKETEQLGQQKLQTMISAGATVLGALFGRKVASVGTVGRATTTMRGLGRASREKQDIARAQQKLEELHTKLQELEAEFEREVEDLQASVDPDAVEITEKAIHPRKSDIAIEPITLVWTPWWIGSDGIATPAHV